MISANKKTKSVDDYISGFPEEIREKLEKIRQTIKDAAPGAEEVISYQMPAYKLKKVLVYFAAFKEHIGFFPTARPIEVFKDKLTAYKTSKGTIRFPLDQPLPLTLIKELVKFRLKENLEIEKLKAKKNRNLK